MKWISCYISITSYIYWFIDSNYFYHIWKVQSSDSSIDTKTLNRIAKYFENVAADFVFWLSCFKWGNQFSSFHLSIKNKTKISGVFRNVLYFSKTFWIYFKVSTWNSFDSLCLSCGLISYSLGISFTVQKYNWNHSENNNMA